MITLAKKKATLHILNKYGTRTLCGLRAINIDAANLRKSDGKERCGRCKIVAASQAKKKGGKK